MSKKIALWLWIAAASLALGCSTDRRGLETEDGSSAGPADSRSADATAESAEARAVVSSIRARFQLKQRVPPAVYAAGRLRDLDLSSIAIDALAPSLIDRVDRDGDWLRPHLPDGIGRGVLRRAEVSLPARAGRPFQLRDVNSGMTVDIALAEASDVAAEVAEGFVIYRHGHRSGADIVHRVTAEGTEDYLAFEQAPQKQELRYELALGDGVAGLRLVANTLELLDAGGAPRLRMAPPYVVDSAGKRHEARVAVRGCAYEADPRMPWGQTVTAPGAKICETSIAWDGAEVIYPALVDPAWSATASMATARYWHAASVLSSGKVLVMGGHDGSSYLASAEVYDPVTSTWSAASSMTQARETHTASVLNNGKVLVAGGHDGNSALASAELYDSSTNTWSAIPNMLQQHNGPTASVLNDGKVFIVGGSGSGIINLKSAELYDPVANIWSPAADMALGRRGLSHTASVLSDGKVLVAGGSDAAGTVTMSAEVYNPANNTWSAAANMPIARETHTSSRLNTGKVLVAGGTNQGGYILMVHEYNSATNTWSPVSWLNSVRELPTASLLSSGKLLVTGGGAPGNTSVASAELYDPTTDTWSSAANMTIGRHYHTASTLTTGGVLVAGGFTVNGVAASAELFTPLLPGNACTQVGECVSGFCVDGFCCNTACDAGPCDACSVALGASANGTCTLFTGPACNDGSACTQPDTCQNGVCVGANPVVCSAQDQCHVAGACFPPTGICTNPKKAAGSVCNDGDVCTQTDTCQNGVCTGSSLVVCTALDQCHVVGVCDAGTGCSNPNKADGSACDDGNACTQADTCQVGVCTGSNPVVCAAPDQCHTAGICAPATGVCSNPAKADGTACNDGNSCTQTDTCQAGICIGANPVVCAAPDQCHTAGVCAPATGVCSNPVKADGTACNDGNSCTQTDTCLAGTCTGANPVVCSAQDQCHLAGACNPGTGICSNPNKADGTMCSDGNACTKSDVCTGGACGGQLYTCTPTTCQASSTCDGAGACTIVNKAGGAGCLSDTNDCTTDTCDGAGTCLHTALSDGTNCGNGLVCSAGACGAGCVIDGTPYMPNKPNPTNDCEVCNPGVSVSVWTKHADGFACSDGNACTKTDTCQAGACSGADPVVCTALDQCHGTGTCDTMSGTCSTPEKADGAECDDTNACTQTDTCLAGVCTGANPIVCAALDPCQDAGSCDTVTGTCSTLVKADGADCDDGNNCTQNDTCSAGVCTGGNAVTCPDPNQCQEKGTCDSSTGTCSNPAKPDGTACIGGTCVAGVCDTGTGGGGSGTGAGGTTGTTGNGTGAGGIGGATVGTGGGNPSSTTGAGGNAPTGGNPDRGSFYSCAAAPLSPSSDAWLGVVTVWGALGFAARRRRRRG